MSHYIITGGCGFIGSHLVDALVDQGHKVTVIDDLSTGKRENLHSKANLVLGNIRHLDLVKKVFHEGIEGCFHLAAIASVQKSTEEWFKTHTVNSAGTVNIFDTCRQHKIPFVYASSAAIYGPNGNLPLVESEPANPLTSYGVDKYSNELQAKIAYDIHGTPNAGFRFFNVYGPRQDPSSPYSGVISIFIQQALEETPFTINGTGEQFRDFIYVHDVIRCLCAGMESLQNQTYIQGAEIYNACTGKQTSLLHLADCIEKIMGRTLGKTFGSERAGDIQRSLGNPKKTFSCLKIQAQTDLESGLARTIQAIADQKLGRRHAS